MSEALATSADASNNTVVPAAPKRGSVSSSGRDTFGTGELAICLSHFDVGVIESIQEFPRGSRRAPKLLIAADQGRFLLKRRARGRDDPFKVAFCHALQLHLAQRQFPLPHLIGTRRENNSMLQLPTGIYELFEFIPGTGFPQTTEATFDSGRVLALFHKIVEHFESPWKAPTGSYHAAESVPTALRQIPKTLKAAPSNLGDLVGELLGRYQDAVAAVEELGISKWPSQITHADWHPGNMLYRENHVVAVIDYDSARSLPRIIDVANGALQFSIVGGDDDVSRWPDAPDEHRLKRFIRGYDSVQLLTRAEVAAIPYLMIEALIAEAVLPIAATGQFGTLSGSAFLEMVQRKAGHLSTHAEKMSTMLAT